MELMQQAPQSRQTPSRRRRRPHLRRTRSLFPRPLLRPPRDCLRARLLRPARAAGGRLHPDASARDRQGVPHADRGHLLHRRPRDGRDWPRRVGHDQDGRGGAAEPERKRAPRRDCDEIAARRVDLSLLPPPPPKLPSSLPLHESPALRPAGGDRRAAQDHQHHCHGGRDVRRRPTTRPEPPS